jgi:hypothetical protein
MSGATMFIDGTWTDGTSGETIRVVSPATGETLADVPSGEQQGKMILTLRTGWGRIQLEDFTDLRTATVDYRNTREGG